MDNDIIFFMNSTKGYPYYSQLYPIFKNEPIYLERDQYKCITFPIPIFKQMEKSNGKPIYKSMYYFEPINKYQNLSFTDIKDLSIEKEHFIDIFLINKNQHKVTINVGLIGFMYQNITFKQHKEEMYQTTSIDLFSALYQLTYENENDINEILNIQENETIEQVATFERKPNFKCKFDINKYTTSEREFILESMLTSEKGLEDFIYLNEIKTEILKPDWLKKGKRLSLNVYLFSLQNRLVNPVRRY